MKRFKSLELLFLLMLLAGVASAAGPARDLSGYDVADGRHSQILTGQPSGAAKSDADTVYMMGGWPGASRSADWVPGDFQSGSGVPDRQDWIGVDLTIHNVTRWQISDWNGRAILDPISPVNHVMWCGELFPVGCPGDDPPQGYGNNYDEWLDWYGTVANNTISTNVTVTARLNVDSEPDYDFLRFEVSRASGQDELINYSGQNTLVPLSQAFTVGVADYVGPGLNQIHLRFHGTSDWSRSDGDCRWPTYGHSQVDNIQVTTNNGVNTYDDFESGAGNWTVAFPPAAGDFSHVWPQLADLDRFNYDPTPLFAFIDDGNVCPGTGGSLGLTWTYGPGGYVFNTTGGLAGPGYHVRNEIWSPAMAWPTSATKQYTGMQYGFVVYTHLPLESHVFYVWHVRSSTDGGATWGPWQDDNFAYYGAIPELLSIANEVTGKLPPNRTHVQLALGAWDMGWTWGYVEATPAPYFDNIRALAYLFPGPALSARDIDLFNDNFPAIGVIDYGNLGQNSVRLDMAHNISPRAHLRNDPGDSIVVNVAVVRPAAIMQNDPQLHYKLHPNHLFDAYRTTGLPLEGVIDGDRTRTSQGSVVPNSWCWDFPDSNFFFPGDMIHYYFQAQDNQFGIIGTTRMPGDTTGFSYFPGMPGYKPLVWEADGRSNFTIRALPHMNSATPGDQPRMLLWNDFDNYGGENEWATSLVNLGYQEGSDYDEYYTIGPSVGVGNGLGGRATGPQLAGYDIMLYTSGNLSNYTLSNGDFWHDSGNDIGLMTDWLSQGGKKWFCTGDDLAHDLGRGPVGLSFRDTFIPMVFNAPDLSPLIQNQINPTVDPEYTNPVGLTQRYIAYGAYKFDAVRATTGSMRIATFLPFSGSPYPYAAALYVPNAGGYGDQVLFLPYDFSFIYDMPYMAPAEVATRTTMLQQILTFFGQAPTHSPTGIGETPALTFSARNFPNPFNPSTKIEYSLPRDEQLSIQIYNVRGELVRTLLNEPTKAGPGSVTWQGDDNRGQKVASGVYFYQVKSADSEIFKKMTLVK